MIIGMTASICSLIYTCLVYVVYLKKVKLRNDENVIYSFLIFTNIGGLILEFLVYLFALFPNIENSLIPNIVERCYLVNLFSWIYLFAIYVYIISFEGKKYNYNIVSNIKIILPLILVYLVFVCLIICLPIEHIITNVGTYSKGLALNVLYISTTLSVIASILFVVKNRKEMKLKKKIPIIGLISCVIFMLILRTFVPEALFVSSMFAFVTILTYFTIENPDIRMAKELAFANEELKNKKDNTLYILNDLSSKMQNSLSKLETFGYKKIDFNNKEEMEKELKYIKNHCTNFVDKVNGLIDIGKIKSGNLTIKESNYETENIIEELNELVNKKIYLKKEKLPSVLYGDKEKIKEIVISIYNYLSSKGNIDIKLDYVKAGRFCKLKFHFISSDIVINDYIYNIRGYGYKDDNFIFYEEKDNILYDKIRKLITLINAKINVINYKNSNELILSINQRINNPYKLLEEKEINKGIKVRYFNLSTKKILLVDDGVNDIREILLLLSPYKVNIDVAKNFKDVKKYLSSNKTYDLILIDDVIYNTNEEDYQVKQYKYYASYDNFKSIIMLSKDNNKNINKYTLYGYDDYIIKPLNKKKLNNLLKKYLK